MSVQTTSFRSLATAAVLGLLCLAPVLSIAQTSGQAGQSGQAGAAQSPTYASLFTPAERSQLQAFWNQPGRLTMSPNMKNGLYQVRETTAASIWLWTYLRSGKKITPPTVDALNAGTPGTTDTWNDWIKAAIAYDRAVAENTCAKFNSIISHSSQASVPLPPNPGPCPDGLAAAAGCPPPFAEAVPITTFNVHFDDIDLSYNDHVMLRPNYQYYRFANGVASEGQSVKDLSPDQLNALYAKAGIDAPTAKVLQEVSQLEGGFDAVNTYDTGYVSVGFIQFASLKEGAGSLGEMMADYKMRAPADFNRDFHQYGIDCQADGTLDVVDPATGVEVTGPTANSVIIQDKRLIAVFQRAGLKSDAFRAEQLGMAVRMFDPVNDMVAVTINGQTVNMRIGDIVHSEAGIATLMDRKVNTGKLSSLSQVLSDVAAAYGCQSAADLSKYEAEIVTKMRYRRNFMADLALTQPVGRNASDPDLASRHQDRGGRKKSGSK